MNGPTSGVIELVEGPGPAGSMTHAKLGDLDVGGAALTGHMSVALRSAISGLTVAPGRQGETVSLRDDILGADSGAVGEAKVSLVSDPNGETVSKTAEQEMGALVERMNALYVDMTVFQVAWSVARRVQQDTAQLLKGQ